MILVIHFPVCTVAEAAPLSVAAFNECPYCGDVGIHEIVHADRRKMARKKGVVTSYCHIVGIIQARHTIIGHVSHSTRPSLLAFTRTQIAPSSTDQQPRANFNTQRYRNTPSNILRVQACTFISLYCVVCYRVDNNPAKTLRQISAYSVLLNSNPTL